MGPICQPEPRAERNTTDYEKRNILELLCLVTSIPLALCIVPKLKKKESDSCVDLIVTSNVMAIVQRSNLSVYAKPGPRVLLKQCGYQRHPYIYTWIVWLGRVKQCHPTCFS